MTGGAVIGRPWHLVAADHVVAERLGATDRQKACGSLCDVVTHRPSTEAAA